MTNIARRSNPGVRFPPPIIFAGGLALGYGLDRYWHALPIAATYGSALTVAGIVALLLGVALIAWGMLTFRAAHTAIMPSRSASRLVLGGPYRFTRNPMYTGLSTVYLGGTAWLDSAWPLVLLPVVLLLMYRLVISREESYLSDAFGDDYAAYKARVRRWL